MIRKPLRSHSGYGHGFTLIELVIVIVVIAILATISAVMYSGIRERAQDVKMESNASTVIKGTKIAEVESGSLVYPEGQPSNPEAFARHYNFGSLADNAVICLTRDHGSSFVIGSGDEACHPWNPKLPKDKVTVSHWRFNSGYTYSYSVGVTRWSIQDQLYKTTNLNVYPDGTVEESTRESADCEMTPGHALCSM